MAKRCLLIAFDSSMLACHDIRRKYKKAEWPSIYTLILHYFPVCTGKIMNNLNESRQCPDQESNHAPHMSEAFCSSHLSRFTESQLKFMTQSLWLLRNTPI